MTIRGTGVALVAVAALGACAAPARRLTPRVVDDPIVLPRRMALVALGGNLTWYPLTDTRTASAKPGWRLGITDRLELYDILSFRYAILDDAPGSPLPPSRLSLAIRAGTPGFGYSSVEGWIAKPLLALQVQKHLAERWRFSGSVGWTALWTEKPPALMSSSSDSPPSARARRYSTVDIGLGAMRQLTSRVALNLAGSAFKLQRCVAPFCHWAYRGLGGALSVLVRPTLWLTLEAGARTGVYYRALVPSDLQDPTLPIAMPARSVAWVGGFCSASFTW